MTIKPRGKKFRIRRSGLSSSTGEVHRPVDNDAESADDGFGNQPFPGSTAFDDQTEQVATSQSIDEELAMIRQEGLTGRQLRMARRASQKQGLNPTSDFDAVRLLRQKGVDPFRRSNMLELVVDEDGKGSTPDEKTYLPATVRHPQGQLPQVSQPQVFDEASRAVEIARVQQAIAARRRKRLALLVARLMFFVMLPTLIAGYYYYVVATPMYATHAEFVIQKAEGGGGSGGGLSSLLGGTTFSTVQDSITVQSYLESPEAMMRLDEELGLREHYSDPNIDSIQRLDPNATNSTMHKLYTRNLSIGYDPTEGLIRMEVIAVDPHISEAFSIALIRYAEERVGQLSQRVREDQMAGARESYLEAEERMLQAQQQIIQLQEQRGVLSASAEVSSIMGQISTFEIQLQEERLSLDELMFNTRPNQTRVEVAERNIARLEALIVQLRSSMTTGETDDVSLARISSEILVAEVEMETRQAMLTQSLQQMETARVEANRQSLYLSIGVNPTAPDEATYPRSLENTLLAFLIFSGIYLMVSMTASILREQVSA
jgi:capsular polysaccharide transport system permease protein